MEIWAFNPEAREGGKAQYKSFDEMCSGRPFSEQIMELGATFYAESRKKVWWLVFEPEEEQHFEEISRALIGDPTCMLAVLLRITGQWILFERAFGCMPCPVYTTEEGLRPEMQDKTKRLAIQYDALS